MTLKNNPRYKIQSEKLTDFKKIEGDESSLDVDIANRVNLEERCLVLKAEDS